VAIRRCLLASLCLLLSHIAFAADAWQTLAPDLAYQRFQPLAMNPWARVHAFRFSLKRYRLAVALASERHRLASSVATFAKQADALLAINGGFFTPTLRPLGLRIRHGEVLSPLRGISWWGIFYVRHNRAHIVPPRAYRSARHIEFAVQGGPRLLVGGRIPPLKRGVAERSAVGITKRGDIILLVTEHYPLSTTDLAKFMREKLQCRDALNLDGGSSSQLYASIGNTKVDVRGLAPVTDAILLTKRLAHHRKQTKRN